MLSISRIFVPPPLIVLNSSPQLEALGDVSLSGRAPNSLAPRLSKILSAILLSSHVSLLMNTGS
jgi:hypothetical protein